MSDINLGGAACAWLLAAGTLSGAASVWTFRRWSDTDKLRASVNSILAHLMEFRLFASEPALILRAQWDLIQANARFLRVLAGPSLLLVIPFALMLGVMDGFFARGPLPIGQAFVITVQGSGSTPEAQLEAPDGFAVETPAVRVPSQHQVSWRLRPTRDAGGSLRVTWGGMIVSKSIQAGAGLHWIAEQRSASLMSFALHPQEWPLATRQIDWVRVQYPSATVLGFHWLMWYSMAACIGALLFLGRVSKA